MVSASKVRNYLNDPLLDWLNEFNITSVYDNPKNVYQILLLENL